ncbi:MAG: response regulator [Bdellovibrionales bacterium]|nr:response regulator [Bdellovibrionales bacterium]
MSLFEGKKFLIVEDDDMLREVIADIFRSEGALVTEASNGVTAFSLVQRNSYDVVFSDVRMPGGDGIGLAKNILGLPGLKPLLFFCSGFNDLTPEKALELNVLVVFEKPFDRISLIEEVSAWLSGKTSSTLAEGADPK